ncbi:hypothetical protein BG015_003197 [Linnemannia schmuckeri]|uniref:Uncharacterized protein n=1 Tax=Linnemannia schmuckeri TaxID=64567 RepID=A0A9P5V5H7_9FUNG|nr:hypothetical protein BG015_003197 [Linnemannia schmuckeri]
MNAIGTALILQIFDPELSPTVETDASGFTVGAALFQADKDGSSLPVASPPTMTRFGIFPLSQISPDDKHGGWNRCRNMISTSRSQILTKPMLHYGVLLFGPRCRPIPVALSSYARAVSATKPSTAFQLVCSALCDA